jgi:hypothetical protein
VTAAAACALLVLAGADVAVVEAEGQGTDEATATHAALRSAVEQVVGVRIGSQTVVKDSLLIEDWIYARSSGVVRHFEVLQKTGAKPEVVTVRVRAEIERGPLDAKLGEIHTLMGELGKHRVFIAINELARGPQPREVDDRPARAFTAVLTETLKRDGWTLIDGAARPGSGSASPEEQQKLAERLGADLIVRGNVVYEREAAESETAAAFRKFNMGPPLIYLSKIPWTLKVDDVATHRNRFTKSGVLLDAMAETVHTSYEVTEAAMCKAGAPPIASALRDGVVEALRNVATEGAEISLNLSQAGFDQVITIGDAVKKLPNVKSAEPHGDFEHGKQTLEVRYRGTAEQLAKALSEMKPRLKLRSVTPGVIEATP